LQILIDTCAVIAMMDKSHHSNKEISKFILEEENTCIVASTVVVEVCQLLKYRFGSRYELDFLREIHKTSFILETVKFEDLPRIIEVLAKYNDLKIGYVDASIVAIAERIKTNKILTLDRKHFGAIVPSGFEYFDILP